MRKTQAQTDPRMVGGRYFSAYWAREYEVTRMYSTVHRAEDDSRWVPGATWLDVLWLDAAEAIHPRVSDQWRGNGYERTTHCTAWDRRDEIVSQPS